MSPWMEFLDWALTRIEHVPLPSMYGISTYIPMKINHMWVNISYMDPMGVEIVFFGSWFWIENRSSFKSACMFFEFQIIFEAEQKHNLYDKRKDRPKIKEMLSLVRRFGLDRAQLHSHSLCLFCNYPSSTKVFATIHFQVRKIWVSGRLWFISGFWVAFVFSPTFFQLSRGDSSFYTCHWRCFGTARCRLKRRSLWRSHRCGFRSLLRFFCDTKSGEAVDGGLNTSLEIHICCKFLSTLKCNHLFMNILRPKFNQPILTIFMCDICVTYLPNESPYLLDLCFFHSEFEPKFLRPEAIFGPGIPDSPH